MFDVGAEAVEIVAKPLLDRVPLCLLRVVARVDTALLEEVVVDLLEDQRVEVAPRLAPVRCLAGLDRSERILPRASVDGPGGGAGVRDGRRRDSSSASQRKPTRTL